MLGRFLELSIVTDDVRTSLEFYDKLGFSQADVGEAWAHPYAALTDGRICLGLHQHSSFEPSTTFVKSGLLQHVLEFERMGIAFEFRRLTGDVFNELGWLDPSGNLTRLVEARTFSPVKRAATDVSLCGYFLEVALAAQSRDISKRHWEQFGFVGMDEMDSRLPHISCTSDSIDIGLYDPALVRRPAMVFELEDFDGGMERLRAEGIVPNGRVPAPLRQLRAALLTAPEGTNLLLLDRAEG